MDIVNLGANGGFVYLSFVLCLLIGFLSVIDRWCESVRRTIDLKKFINGDEFVTFYEFMQFARSSSFGKRYGPGVYVICNDSKHKYYVDCVGGGVES